MHFSSLMSDFLYIKKSKPKLRFSLCTASFASPLLFMKSLLFLFKCLFIAVWRLCVCVVNAYASHPHFSFISFFAPKLHIFIYASERQKAGHKTHERKQNATIYRYQCKIEFRFFHVLVFCSRFFLHCVYLFLAPSFCFCWCELKGFGRRNTMQTYKICMRQHRFHLLKNLNLPCCLILGTARIFN